MDHDEVVRSSAAERYVAHELSAEERNAFEAHFFDCPECAAEVRFELSFAANIRAVCRDQRKARALRAPAAPNATSPARWPIWVRQRPVFIFSFAANLIFVAAVVYLIAVPRPSGNARFLRAYFAPGPAHGASDVHDLPQGAAAYIARFPAASPSATQSYTYEILDENGKRQSSATLAAPASADGFLYLQIPITGLPAGVHTLVVKSGNANDIVSWSRFKTTH